VARTKGAAPDLEDLTYRGFHQSRRDFARAGDRVGTVTPGLATLWLNSPAPLRFHSQPNHPGITEPVSYRLS